MHIISDRFDQMPNGVAMTDGAEHLWEQLQLTRGRPYRPEVAMVDRSCGPDWPSRRPTCRTATCVAANILLPTLHNYKEQLLQSSSAVQVEQFSINAVASQCQSRHDGFHSSMAGLTSRMLPFSCARRSNILKEERSRKGREEK